MTELRMYQRVEATFTPLRMDDLKPSVAAAIGRRTVWQVTFKIESGPYQGMWAMMPLSSRFLGEDAGWSPDCDLSEIKLVREAP